MHNILLKMFLFFSMLLLCSFCRLKELFQVKNGLTRSLLFLGGGRGMPKNLGRSDNTKRRKKRFHSFFQLLTWTSLGNPVNTTEKSTLKLVKLPSLKVICRKPYKRLYIFATLQSYIFAH